MSELKRIVILCGGESDERAVSLKSAEPVLKVLEKFYWVHCIHLNVNILPEELDPKRDLVFPLIHGDFGEDGRLQKLLEAEHFTFIGSNSNASALCIDKLRSKQLAQKHGLPVLPAIPIQAGEYLDEAFICGQLGTTTFVLKPTNKGSSIGVHLCKDFNELRSIWSQIREGYWMIERYVKGRELTVGVFQGEALGAVEICPKEGFYDYKNKYTPGACDYFAPAPISSELLKQLQTIAKDFYQYAGCLDLGRVDFILENNQKVWLLEMNTIPGMTECSLFPKSAACVGIDFETLLVRLVEGACQRFQE